MVKRFGTSNFCLKFNSFNFGANDDKLFVYLDLISLNLLGYDEANSFFFFLTSYHNINTQLINVLYSKYIIFSKRLKYCILFYSVSR